VAQRVLAQNPVFKEINDTDVNNLTPMEALMKISQWKKDLEDNGVG